MINGFLDGQKMSAEEFNKLPLKERALLRASTKLMKHFRGLEAANLLTKDAAAEYIGYVKDLLRLAEGEEINNYNQSY